MEYLDLYVLQDDGSYKLKTLHESDLPLYNNEEVITKEEFINAYID